jgi:hypothetical protein
MKNVRESAVVFVLALFALFLLPHGALAASPAAGQAPAPAKMDAKSDCPCDCDCAKCGQECTCGHMHGGHGKPHMMMGGMEGMKKHMEEVRKTVTALRDHEKKMEGITDPAEFRKAAMEHFRMLDDLQESHVKHMESMMGGKGHGPHHH